MWIVLICIVREHIAEKLEAREREQFIPKMTQYYGLFISPQKIDFLNLSYTNIITNQNYQFEPLND